MQPRLLKEPLRLAGPALLALQSDDRLVRLVRDGHQPAFAAIVDRYRPALLRYCTGLVGEQRAEDAVQQALVNAHRALTERETAVDLRPWLYRIAHNAAINTMRGETGGWSLDDPDAADALARTAGSAEDLEAVVVRRERLRQTLTAICDLPDTQRDALLLRELEGRSHVEIAAALGVTAGAARQHLMRARAAVRAAAAAITPYPLLVKAATWATFTPTGESVTKLAAGAGLGAGAAKVAAGVLATGAIVGGAVGTGALPSAPGDRPPGAAPATSGPPEARSGTALVRSPVARRAVPTAPRAGAPAGDGRRPVPAVATTPRRPVWTPAATGATSDREVAERPATSGRSDEEDDTDHDSGSGARPQEDDRRTAADEDHASGSAVDDETGTADPPSGPDAERSGPDADDPEDHPSSGGDDAIGESASAVDDPDDDVRSADEHDVVVDD